jgi:AraC-like DNA-binding protein
MGQNNLQSAFFAKIDDASTFKNMFDHLSNVFFFAKDLESRLVSASKPILERLGVKDEREIIGTTDDQFFPEAIAKGFREDDHFVFTTGTTLPNRLEVWFDEKKNLDWFLTTKVPLKDNRGKVFGLMGVTRQADNLPSRPFCENTATAISYLENNSDRILTTAEIAEVCGLSERTLHRKILETTGTTPYELMLKIRIRKAAESLITYPQKSILEIALLHGFCDQSSFTQHFRKRTGMTPKKFRQRHGSGAAEL